MLKHKQSCLKFMLILNHLVKTLFLVTMEIYKPESYFPKNFFMKGCLKVIVLKVKAREPHSQIWGCITIWLPQLLLSSRIKMVGRELQAIQRPKMDGLPSKLPMALKIGKAHLCDFPFLGLPGTQNLSEGFEQKAGSALFFSSPPPPLQKSNCEKQTNKKAIVTRNKSGRNGLCCLHKPG